MYALQESVEMHTEHFGARSKPFLVLFFFFNFYFRFCLATAPKRIFTEPQNVLYPTHRHPSPLFTLRANLCAIGGPHGNIFHFH